MKGQTMARWDMRDPEPGEAGDTGTEKQVRSRILEEMSTPEGAKRVIGDSTEALHERAEHLRGRITPTMVGFAAAGLLGLVAIGGFARPAMGTSDFERTVAANKVTIQQLTNELDATKGKTPSSAVVVRAQASNAQAAGSAVAQAQNEYRDARADPARLAIAAKAMDAQLADGASAARVPWYTAPSAVVGSITAPYMWSFASTYDFGGDSVKVLWRCNETQTAKMLAWATATYDVKTRKFSNVTWASTKRGIELAGAKDNYTSPTPIADPNADKATDEVSPVVPLPSSTPSTKGAK